MRVSELIIKKRNGESLSQEEINLLIKNYVTGKIPDYQLSALLMAIYFQGMNPTETGALTLAMAQSGEMIDLSSLPGPIVDKHSTGGIADTTTLVLTPLIAAAGIPVAKMSGRGLGHTGGTIDKLESIPGFKTALLKDEFIRQVQNIQLAVAGQTGNMVPADQKLYALRDVTGTVDSIPLIASSIMSKKIASGAEAIVLDVKTGTGAFMQDVEKAFSLAEAMVKIGQQVGRKTVAVISDMNEPLGLSIGNALEVEEAILTLQGNKKGKLRELSLVLGSLILQLVGQVRELSQGYHRLAALLDSNAALEKFAQMIKAQGGNAAVIKDLSLLPQAKFKKEILCEEDGYLMIENAWVFGIMAMILGAGRETKESIIDLAVGIKLHGRTGDKISKGETLLTFYYNDEKRLTEALKMIPQALCIQSEPVAKRPLILGKVTKDGRGSLKTTF